MSSGDPAVGRMSEYGYQSFENHSPLLPPYMKNLKIIFLLLKNYNLAECGIIKL
jgi:hypothetical protein